MRMQGGLRPEDWRRWGQLTTFKANAAHLLRREVRSWQKIYCSPLVDPYQPAEESYGAMPAILTALTEAPPGVFVVQTRGPLILRDLERLRRLASVCQVRVSFSLTTDREDIRRLYEPHCAPLDERLRAIAGLRAAGIRTFATLAPILPCNPAALARAAIDATGEDLVGDPFHTRAAKRHGATTRPQAEAVSRRHGFERWHEPGFQDEITGVIRGVAEAAGRRFGTGPEAFGWLAQ